MLLRSALSALLSAAGLAGCGPSTSNDSDATAERLTAHAAGFEYRGVSYATKAGLVAALRSSNPQPARLAVQWVANGNAPAEHDAASANAAVAFAAAQEAGIPVSRGMVGNEVFTPKSSKAASSSAPSH